MLRDAELLPYEIDDYDTISFQEEGEHPTGINKTRMRLPEFYDITKYYQRLKRNSRAKWYNPETDEYETVVRNKGEYGHWKKLAKRDLPDITDVKGIKWQITYNFPEELHDNISPLGNIYGGNTVTYRRLYLILCERFNNKEYFVDTYFRDVYPNTMKEQVDVELQTVKDELEMYRAHVVLNGAKITKSGNLDKRYHKQNAPYYKALRDYDKFKESWEDEKGDELAELIADDIKRALSVGEIPLNREHTVKTEKKRIQAGYSADPVFYAMGDLIDHIQIYVKIRS